MYTYFLYNFNISHSIDSFSYVVLQNSTATRGVSSSYTNVAALIGWSYILQTNICDFCLNSKPNSTCSHMVLIFISRWPHHLINKVHAYLDRKVANLELCILSLLQFTCCSIVALLGAPKHNYLHPQHSYAHIHKEKEADDMNNNSQGTDDPELFCARLCQLRLQLVTATVISQQQWLAAATASGKYQTGQ